MTLLRLLPAVLTLLLFSSLSASAQNEYIVCSGGPALRQWEDLRRSEQQHDRWWGNFVRTARVRLQELRRTQPPGTILTWLVFRDAYARRAAEDGDPLVSHVESVRDTYKVNLVWFRSGEEVIQYLNAGGAHAPRARHKVAGFEFFGHSNKHCFLFDYSSEIYASSTAWLHENDLHRIRRGVFARGAFCKSWGCHTGESMSRYWRKATGTRLIGAIGKTDYSYMHLRNWQVALSPGSRWVD